MSDYMDAYIKQKEAPQKQGQFVGYYLDDKGKDHVITTGNTKDDALNKAIITVLSMGIATGAIAAEEKPNLTPEEYAQVVKVCEEFALKHNIRVK